LHEIIGYARTAAVLKKNGERGAIFCGYGTSVENMESGDTCCECSAPFAVQRAVVY